MPAELERIRKVIKRENPEMPEGKTWAIATATYKHKHGLKTEAEKNAASNFDPRYLALAAPVVTGLGGYAYAQHHQNKWLKEHSAQLAAGAVTAGLGAAALTGHAQGMISSPEAQSFGIDSSKLVLAVDDAVDAYQEYNAMQKLKDHDQRKQASYRNGSIRRAVLRLVKLWKEQQHE